MHMIVNIRFVGIFSTKLPFDSTTKFRSAFSLFFSHCFWHVTAVERMLSGRMLLPLIIV